MDIVRLRFSVAEETAKWMSTCLGEYDWLNRR